MSDLSLNFAALPNEQPGDDDAREARHQLLAMLLGAYADGELPAETVSQIDAHLLGCSRCRREVDIQVVLRERLNREPVPAATPAFRDRIVGAVAKLPTPAPIVEVPVITVAQDAAMSSRWRTQWHKHWRTIATVALAVMATLPVASWTVRAVSARVSLGPVGTAASAALFSEVLADYRRVTAGDLPGRARDLQAVRAAVPFPVEPLHAASLSLLASWTTDLNGEPAAVLAYRWGDRLVLEYIVAEQELFRYPAIRSRIAARKVAAVSDGQQSLLAWGAPAVGAVLVADVTLSDLSVLRSNVVAR